MTAITEGLNRLRRLLTAFEAGLAGLCLLLMILLTLGHIIARDFFGTGLPLASSLPRFLVLYVTFLGAALAIDRDRHIKIDVLSQWLPEDWRHRLYRPLQAVGALVTGILLHAAVRFWRDEWHFAVGNDRWNALLTLIIPVGFGLLCTHFLLGLILGRRIPEMRR